MEALAAVGTPKCYKRFLPSDWLFALTNERDPRFLGLLAARQPAWHSLAGRPPVGAVSDVGDFRFLLIPTPPRARDRS